MQTVKTPIYQTAQIRELERLAGERLNVAAEVLMQRAGKAALDFLLKRWPQVKRLAIFCGSGNNGGDGYVLAQLAHERQMNVKIWQVGNHEKLADIARAAYERCVQSGILMDALNAQSDIAHPDLIVDAICGIGLKANLREEAVLAIEKMQRSHVPIFSLDVPTGIDADTGHILGAAVSATATITFIGIKLGLVTGNGIAYTGELISSDLQLPSELFSYVQPVAEKLHMSAYVDYLKPRLRDWHKGLSGHLLIVGGDLGYSGAPRMAAEAALRVGAGLVTVACHPDNAAVMNIGRPEIMCHGIKKAEELLPLIEKVDVIVMGPGLGQSDWAKKLWKIVTEQPIPLVLDADALNILCTNKHSSEHWVLTPHPGEAARLLDETPQTIQQDRLAAVKEINKGYGGVTVLKGAGSLIDAPSALVGVCDKGNPGMASAGMGDVLSGVIGGLIAQGIPMGDAAKIGVLLHAKAGDLAAKEGERGMIASDLMPHLRRLMNFSGTI